MSDTTGPAQNRIDPRSPRFGAAITTVLLAISAVLTLVPATNGPGLVLLALIVALFAWGGFAGIRRHPYGALFRRLVRPHLAPPAELEDAAPPTFAQRVGFVVSGAGLLLALLGVPYAAPVGAALALIAALLNAAFDLCIGCILYVWLVRVGLIRSTPAV